MQTALNGSIRLRQPPISMSPSSWMPENRVAGPGMVMPLRNIAPKVKLLSLRYNQYSLPFTNCPPRHHTFNVTSMMIVIQFLCTMKPSSNQLNFPQHQQLQQQHQQHQYRHLQQQQQLPLTLPNLQKVDIHWKFLILM